MTRAECGEGEVDTRTKTFACIICDYDVLSRYLYGNVQWICVEKGRVLDGDDKRAFSDEFDKIIVSAFNMQMLATA